MNLYIAKNKKIGDKKAFQIIRKDVLKKPALLIGLAAGKTTDNLYKLISKDVVKNSKKWKRIKIFQIDENLGKSPNSHVSFNHEIKRELKSLIKILPKENVFLIDGTKEPRTTIKDGYKFIKKSKGIDLTILGLGPEYDPHIAYNTTGKSTLNSRFRVVKLHPRISKKVKTAYGITIGIEEILESKKVLLIAYGKDKAKSIRLAFDPTCGFLNKASASALLLHKNLVVITDKEAAKHLTNSNVK